MEQIDPIKLGKFLRQKREELGYRLEDLEDQEISSATISNIERGKSTLKSKKIIYLCQKLHVDSSEVSNLIQSNKNREIFIKQRLQGLSVTIEFDANYVLQQLEEISLTNLDSLIPYVEFLKGKAYTNKKSWTNAKNHFVEGIEIINRNKTLNKTNLKTICLTELSRIYYFNNEPEQAVNYVNEGLQEFEPNGERTECLYVSLACKAIYLDELGRRYDSIEKKQEALDVIDEILKDTSKIKNMEVLLSAYELKGSLLRRLQLPNKALPFILEGITLSKTNSMLERSVDLWTELGQIYLDIEELEEAEFALKTAICFEDDVSKQFFLVTYTVLGNVYMRNKEWKKAQKCFKTVIEHITTDTPISKYIDAYIGLADCYLSLKQSEKALKTFQFALQKCKEFELKNKENYVCVKLCECTRDSDNKLFSTYLENLFQIQKQLFKIKT